VPGLDSIDLWPSLAQPHAAATNRTELALAYCDAAAECDTPGGEGDHALIVVEGARWWKLVNGSQGGLGFWQSPHYPNASSAFTPSAYPGCPSGCLFDVMADPSEHEDLRHAFPEVFSRLVDRLVHHYGASTYQTNYSTAETCITVHEAWARDGGFLAPRCS
jgi:hypothetical protein